jgi:hypothetical protein
VEITCKAFRRAYRNLRLKELRAAPAPVKSRIPNDFSPVMIVVSLRYGKAKRVLNKATSGPATTAKRDWELI